MIEACAAEAPLFRNDDWCVSDEGLEHRATGYFIAATALATRRGDGLWDWPLQMAEKRWVRPSLFREAFLAALDRFGIARDAGLGRAFALGFGIRAGQEPETGGFIRLGNLLRAQPVPMPVAAAPRARRIAVRA